MYSIFKPEFIYYKIGYKYSLKNYYIGTYNGGYMLHRENGPAIISSADSKYNCWYLFGWNYKTIDGLLQVLSLTSKMVKILAPTWRGKSLKANLLMKHIIKNNNFSKLNKRQKEKIYKLGDNYLTRKLYGRNEEWKEYMMIRDIIK